MRGRPRNVGAADARCAEAGAYLPVMDRGTYERVVATARATLDPRKFATAYAAGQRLPPEAAVTEAVALATQFADGAATAGAGEGGPPSTAARVQLTPREGDVLRRLVEGQGDAQIAWTLGVSPRTVADHVLRLRRKLGLPNRTALAVYAVRQRLVEDAPARLP